MGIHCKTCQCNLKGEKKYEEFPCEYCGILCRRNQKRALCSLKCRLLGNIENYNGCFIWRGKIGTDGYGLIMIDKKRKRVSRVAFELFHSPIPDGYIICHSCDNPACINPKHLFVGTHEDNMYDMVIKGRAAKGNQYTRGYRKIPRRE